MKKRNRIWITAISILAAVLLIAGAFCLIVPNAEYGFARDVPQEEAVTRLQVIETAENWLGANEADGSHHPIVDLYNSHEPVAQGYLVQYDDSWCATFVSTVSIQCSLTDIIPTECSCQRQIGLFSDLNRWEEDDAYHPLPGDIIFYSWGSQIIGDCTDWSDHVGIVVGTWGPFIKVIEGNMNDAVRYRYIPINFPGIRGYGLPDYQSKCDQNQPAE